MIVRFLTLLAFACCFQGVFSQEKNILTHLKQAEVGKGDVQIVQNPLLDTLMKKQRDNSQLQLVQEDGFNFIVGRGYRIQVFSSNNQREAKQEAYDKRVEIQELLPEIPTYITYQSPFWKLRAGNFSTMEEAQAAIQKLRVEFPAWKEMFIVKDMIKIPVYEQISIDSSNEEVIEQQADTFNYYH